MISIKSLNSYRGSNCVDLYCIHASYLHTCLLYTMCLEDQLMDFQTHNNSFMQMHHDVHDTLQYCLYRDIWKAYTKISDHFPFSWTSWHIGTFGIFIGYDLLGHFIHDWKVRLIMSRFGVIYENTSGHIILLSIYKTTFQYVAGCSVAKTQCQVNFVVAVI